MSTNNFTLPYASQLACRHSDTTIPGPNVLANSSVALCSISTFAPGAEVILSKCCHSPTSISINTNPGNSSNPFAFQRAQTAGYSVDGCDWRYCNVTGQSGIDYFDNCLLTTAKLLMAGTDTKGQCFMDGKAVAGRNMTITSDGTRSGDATKIQWRSNKKKEKQTISAALLIALGVAGIVLGS